MDITINKNSDVFNLQGKINSSTADQYSTYFEHLLSSNGKLTINMDEVAEIDEKGIQALFQVHVYALRYNYSFSIVGQGCKDIYNEFRYQNVA
jgi:anti-anti-sigma regulatory factor